MFRRFITLVAGLRKTLEALVRGGKRVTLLGPVPEQHWPAPECLARQRWNNPTLVCDEDFRKVSARLLPVERALKALAGDFPAGQVCYVSVWPVFCDATVCRSSGPEGTYYYDDDHLSATGARYLLGRLDL